MNIDDTEIKYDPEAKRLTITFNYNSPIGHKPKIFVKPSEDYGIYDQSRGTSAYNDFLTILRNGSLKVTNQIEGSPTYTFKLGEGDNYSNGFYVKLDLQDRPVGVNADEVIIFDVEYTQADRPLRIGFEVY